jgi:hypothetical protein
VVRSRWAIWDRCRTSPVSAAGIRAAFDDSDRFIAVIAGIWKKSLNLPIDRAPSSRGCRILIGVEVRRLWMVRSRHAPAQGAANDLEIHARIGSLPGQPVGLVGDRPWSPAGGPYLSGSCFARAFPLRWPPFDQAQGGPSAALRARVSHGEWGGIPTRNGRILSSFGNWIAVCADHSLWEQMSVVSWSSKPHRGIHANRRFVAVNDGNRDRAHERWPSRRSDDQNVTNEPKRVRWLEMHKMRLEL